MQACRIRKSGLNSYLKVQGFKLASVEEKRRRNFAYSVNMACKKQIMILDGGTGTALQKMGHNFIESDPLWSAAVVHTHPQDIIKLHKEFYTSGADVVLTATYQASVEGYKKSFSLDDDSAFNLVKQGVTLAKTARDESERETGRRLYVAASIGPYGAVLHDFSEYNGKYADSMTKQELSDWHLPRMKAIVEAKPDILAIETIPVLKEAEAILDNLSHFPDIKAWLTFQCKDGTSTGHGESIHEAVQLAASHPNVIATGFNCVHPKYVSSLLQQIAKSGIKKPIIVKPDGHNEWNSSDRRKLTDHVDEWIKLGASWIGGCCHIYNNDIADLRSVLEQRDDVCLLSKSDIFV